MSFFKVQSLYPFNNDHNKLPHFREITDKFNGPIICDSEDRKHFTFLEADRKTLVDRLAEGFDDPYEPLYITNGLGFRSEEQYKKEDGPNAIMFAGDSFTYGIGSRQHEIFPHYVSEDLDMVNWNVGAGGQGNEVISLMVNHFLLAGYIPKKLVVTWSYKDRKVIFDKPTFGKAEPEELKMVTFLPGGMTFRTYPHMNDDLAFKSWLGLADNQAYFMFWTYRNMLLEICKKYNVEVVEGFLDLDLYQFAENTLKPEKYIKMCLHRDFPPDLVDGTRLLGRDRQHWGADVHRKVADLYLELLNDGAHSE